MNRVAETVQDLKGAAREARGQLEREVAAQVTKALAKQQVTLTEQQKTVQRLEVEVEALKKGQELLFKRGRSSGGGFPWGLVLLAGGAYYLYRSNPSFRDRVQLLLGRADPGIQGNLARAGDAVKDAVSSVAQGERPGDALRTAGGELKRAGEKAVDEARDRVQDLKRDVQGGAQDLKREAGRAADDVRDDLKRH